MGLGQPGPIFNILMEASMGRGRPRTEVAEVGTSVQFSKNQVEQRGRDEALASKKVIEKWYALIGNKIVQKTKTGLGSVHSVYLGDRQTPKGKAFLNKCKADGVRVEIV